MSGWAIFNTSILQDGALSKRKIGRGICKSGNVVIITNRKGKMILERRKYEHDYPGAFADDIWTGITNLTGSDRELIGYPTQKPLETTMTRIIMKHPVAKGDMVLDPFCWLRHHLRGGRATSAGNGIRHRSLEQGGRSCTGQTGKGRPDSSEIHKAQRTETGRCSCILLSGICTSHPNCL